MSEKKIYTGQLRKQLDFVDPTLLVGEAQERAEAIIAEAEQEAEQIRSQAQFMSDEATQALMHSQAEAERIIAQAQTKAEEAVSRQLIVAQRTMRDNIGQARLLIAQLIGEAVEKIIGKELGEKAYIHMIDHAITELRTRHDIILHINTADEERVLPFIEQWRSHPTNPPIHLMFSPTIEAGLCRIEASGVSVTVGLQAQLALLKELLTDTEIRENIVAAEPSL